MRRFFATSANVVALAGLIAFRWSATREPSAEQPTVMVLIGIGMAVAAWGAGILTVPFWKDMFGGGSKTKAVLERIGQHLGALLACGCGIAHRRDDEPAAAVIASVLFGALLVLQLAVLLFRRKR